MQRSYRYKIAYGGRGSSKSWTFCAMLLSKARQKQTRILCCREIQTSIKASVHQLLSNLIFRNGWQYEFKITAQQIRHLETGSIFTFAGLKNNPESVKSTEGVDICFIEEGQTISQQSMELLIPTIRKPGSEIWIAMNPRYEFDYCYERFVKQKADNVLCKRVNYTDNPWFPDVLREELERDKAFNYGMYLHTWEGELRPYGERPAFSKDSLVWDGGRPDGVPELYGLDLSYSGRNALVGISTSPDGSVLFIDSAASATAVPLQQMSEWLGPIDNAVVVDSARPEVIRLLKDQGYTIRPSKKGAGSVLRGIDKLNQFKEIRFMEGTEEAYQEFSKLGFDDNENVVGDRDFVDAVRYALERNGGMKVIPWGALRRAG
jgi:phage terminase large subunit